MRDVLRGGLRDDEDPIIDENTQRLPRDRTLAPRGPKKFRAFQTGNGIRVVVTDWSHEAIVTAGSGSMQYFVYWAESVDMTTEQGVLNGFARATLLAPAIPAPMKEDAEATAFYADVKYLTGSFYCVGVDAGGEQSPPGTPIRITTGTGGAIPPDVEHFQASESGEVHDGTTYSAVGYSFKIPEGGQDIDHVQFYYRNYPNLNQTSEGESVRITTGLGGTQTGKLKLPIGRRIGTGTITIAGTTVTGSSTLLQTLAATSGGDQIEAFGLRGRIASVASNTALTLSSTWSTIFTVTNATNATPIVITTSAAHEFQTGQSVVVAGVVGNTAANGTWTVTVLSTTTFSLNTSVGSGAYVSGGTAVRQFTFLSNEWQVIGSVTIYAVSEGINGARRDDIENAPSVLVDLDGELSAPNAPSLSALDLANGIRLYITPPTGTQIESVTLYRGSGAGLAFSACNRIQTWPQDKISSSPFLEYFDYDFTLYEKENGQTFSYYAVAMNVRGGQSAPSTRQEASPRLASGQDVDPTLTGRVGVKQMLYNAMFSGTSGNTVAETDTSQDANVFTDASNLPGKPYGGGGAADGTGRYKGYTRWHSTKTAGAPTLATHQNGNEIKMPAPTAVGQFVYVFEEIGAWDSASGAQFIKIAKNGVAVFSVYAKMTGSPSGSLHVLLEQYDNNTHRGWVPRRYRDVNSVLQYYDDTTWGSTNELSIAGSLLTTSWQRFYAVFRYNGAMGTTKQIRTTFSHADSLNGDIYICRPMLNEGEELGFWTGDMGDPYVSQPIPTGDPPSGIGDGDGRRIGRIPEA